MIHPKALQCYPTQVINTGSMARAMLLTNKGKLPDENKCALSQPKAKKKRGSERSKGHRPKLKSLKQQLRAHSVPLHL